MAARFRRRPQSSEWTLPVSFDMKRRDQSTPPEASQGSRRLCGESLIMSIMCVDILKLLMGALKATQPTARNAC
jgi:hypothetical protein